MTEESRVDAPAEGDAHRTMVYVVGVPQPLHVDKTVDEIKQTMLSRRDVLVPLPQVMAYGAGAHTREVWVRPRDIKAVTAE